MNRNTSFIVLFLLTVSFFSVKAFGQKWVHHTFEHFSKGKLDASGQNIYITKKGEIRSVRRFDLNSDGFIDLLFNSTHDDELAIPASLTTISSTRQMQTKSISVEGSLASDIADLNRDGYPDIVFCPNPSGAQTAHRYVTLVYGAEDGWPPHRANGLLPVNGAQAVLAIDLNGDGWPDIATLNSRAWLPGQPDGSIARIYWGSKKGFILTDFQDIGVEKAFKMVKGDFDSDGIQDVAFLTQDNAIQIVWGAKDTSRPQLTVLKIPGSVPLSMASADVNKDGFSDFIVGSNQSLYLLKGKGQRNWYTPGVISNSTASSIAIEDLDKDGNMDLVISDFSLQRSAGGEMSNGKKTDDNSIKVLWGDHGSFSSSEMDLLEAPYTVSSAMADLDNDGLMDIVCANYQGEKSHMVESIIYFGLGNRKFERHKKGISGNGAYHVAILPAQKDLPAAVVISNSKKGSLNEEIPLFLYYGSANGFKESNRLEIPFNSGYESSAADLNADGYVDLIAINSMHGGQKDNPYRGVNIFWGGSDGYDLQNRRTVLHEENASTSNVADLNQDGYLDLIIGFFDQYSNEPTKLVIYYGSEKGYELKSRVAILSEGRSSSPTVADYNHDGWLDIAVSSYAKDLIRVFWGSKEGFNEKSQQQIRFPSVIDLETADLNNDGYLDLIASSYNDKVNHHHDSGVMLFWGSAKGFMEWNAQWLPANTVLGPAAADFDQDGYLDLFFPSYHGDVSRESLPMYLYWGGPNGFDVNKRKIFIGDSGSDALAADFDQDGQIDLAIASHATDKSHSQAISHVYYNDGNRFNSKNIKTEALPSPGCHWMWNYDLGNIYTRKSEQSYVSANLNWNKKATAGKINFEADVPAHSNLSLSVRTAASQEALKEMKWTTVQGDAFAIGPEDRYLQYQVILNSKNGDSYPVLKKISINLN